MRRVEWRAEYKVHESQADHDWTSIRVNGERQARMWLDRWAKGGVVIAARIVRSESLVVTRWDKPK